MTSTQPEPPYGEIWIFVNKIDPTEKQPWCVWWRETTTSRNGMQKSKVRKRTATDFRIGSIVTQRTYPHLDKGVKPRAMIVTSGIMVWERKNRQSVVTIFPSVEHLPVPEVR